ncbi:MAG: FAD-dependent oxidoreductase [Acidimicrobiales bacterium]
MANTPEPLVELPDEASADLTAKEIADLEKYGTRRPIAKGDYLYRAGDTTYDFYVVISGLIDVVIGEGEDEQVLVRHGPGRFLGELNLLTGMRVFVSTRVVEPGEVLAVPRDSLRRVIATVPELGDKILAALVSRRSVLLTGAASTIRVVGSQYSPESLRLREYLARLRIPHEWLDPDQDAGIDALLEQAAVEPDELPVVITTTTVLRRATPGELAVYLGLTVDSLPEQVFDLVVVGGGPAGLATAVYGASEGLATLGVDMESVGGQAGSSSRIENYLGFPLGISGSDLAQRAVVQAEKFGANLTTPCEATSLREDGGYMIMKLSDGSEVTGRAIVVATGASYRRLPIPGLERFEGNGVYYAATETEAKQCAASPVVVAGGGNSAGQAAIFLSQSGSPVTVVIRGDDLGAHMSRYLTDRIDAHPGIEVRTKTRITGLDGDKTLRSVHLEGPDGEIDLPCAGLFSFIGADPASGWISGCAALDDHGFVLTDRQLEDEDLGETWELLGRLPLPYETNRPGLFAVGDVRSGSVKRVAAAVGEGSACVSSIHQFLTFSQ